MIFFFFSSRRRHTRLVSDWSSDVCSSDLRSSGALQGHVVVCGFGRVGSAIGEALETFGVPYVAIETDPDIVKSLRARGVPAVFGDAAQRIILAAARAERAALVILTVPETERARLAVRRLRALNPGAPVLARAWDLAGRDRLAEEGAAEVIPPEPEAAGTLIRTPSRACRCRDARCSGTSTGTAAPWTAVPPAAG